MRTRSDYIDCVKAIGTCLVIIGHTFGLTFTHPLAFKLVGLLQVNYFGYDKQLLIDWGVVSSDIQWLILDCIVGIVVPLAGSCFAKKAAKIYFERRR